MNKKNKAILTLDDLIQIHNHSGKIAQVAKSKKLAQLSEIAFDLVKICAAWGRIRKRKFFKGTILRDSSWFDQKTEILEKSISNLIRDWDLTPEDIEDEWEAHWNSADECIQEMITSDIGTVHQYSEIIRGWIKDELYWIKSDSSLKVCPDCEGSGYVIIWGEDSEEVPASYKEKYPNDYSRNLDDGPEQESYECHTCLGTGHLEPYDNFSFERRNRIIDNKK